MASSPGEGTPRRGSGTRLPGRRSSGKGLWGCPPRPEDAADLEAEVILQAACLVLVDDELPPRRGRRQRVPALALATDGHTATDPKRPAPRALRPRSPTGPERPPPRVAALLQVGPPPARAFPRRRMHQRCQIGRGRAAAWMASGARVSVSRR